LTVVEGIIVDIMKNNSDADLNCNGLLGWTDVMPGDTLHGNFSVENIGNPGSLLNWEIESHPDWGTWKFSPSNGNDLSPSDEPVTVEVTIIAPDKKDKEFNGGIKIVNKESSGDCFIIQVSLRTQKKLTLINQFFLKYLENYFHMFPIIKHLLKFL
jgi:hypothetical protein